MIGAGSSLSLLALSLAAGQLEDLLWDTLPDAFGLSGTSDGWIFLLLTLTGVAVGLVVWKVPHHAGPDPATQTLVSPPLAPVVLPGVALATILGLAGGVSLGPENPIMAINIGLVVALGTQFVPRAKPALWVMCAVAGTIGAMFGTPVAAALLLSEASAGSGEAPLWDRLFAPLVAAGAGALTTLLLYAELSFSIALAPYRGPELVDLLSGSVVVAASAIIALVAVYAFPRAHALFRSFQHPMLMLPLGGAVLGLLGVAGGSITLFKGLEQMKDLASTADDYSSADLALMFVVKLAALVVAGSCGFRGGRIFPAVFVGVALGLFVSDVVSDVPPPLAVSAAVLGVLLAISRDGWLSLFVALTVVGEVSLLPILCVVILPGWLVVTGRPEMLISLGADREDRGDGPSNAA